MTILLCSKGAPISEISVTRGYCIISTLVLSLPENVSSLLTEQLKGWTFMKFHKLQPNINLTWLLPLLIKLLYVLLES